MCLACALVCFVCVCNLNIVFCQAEDGIRALVRSRGLGDVYKRQEDADRVRMPSGDGAILALVGQGADAASMIEPYATCLLYTSDAADERSSVDLGGRRIIKKKNTKKKKKKQTMT